MSLVPFDQPEEAVVQKTEVVPANPKDTPAWWVKTLNCLRTAIGLKPLYLAERFAIAKVRLVEVESESRHADNHIKLLNAKLEAEKVMSAVRIAEAEANTKKERETAITRHIAAQTKDLQERARLAAKARKHLEDISKTPKELTEHLQSLIKQIEMAGGSVELDIPDLPTPKEKDKD